ncbi:MAG: GNAT family N-acetyltransferase [Anaerolineae bacterium]|nr:GNAT family N-acetyltransferase [Anaerolineae bacterium]
MALYTALPDDSPVPSSLITERLLLRAPRGGDAPLVHAAIYDSFESLSQWMPWARRLPDISESELFVREARTRFRNREELNFLIFPRERGPLLGAISLHTIDWSVPRFEIGYWLRDSARGKGMMTEAIRALTAVGFERLEAERMEIRCDSRNERSAAAARRAGYMLEAVLRRQARDNAGQLRDTLVFARFPDEEG